MSWPSTVLEEMSEGAMSLDRRRVNYLFLCEHGSVSADGKATYAGVFDRLFVDRFPAQHPGLTVAGRLTGPEDGEQELWVFYRDSQGDDVMPPLGPMTVRYSSYGTAEMRVNIRGLPVQKHGIFHIGLMTVEKQVLGYTVLLI